MLLESNEDVLGRYIFGSTRKPESDDGKVPRIEIYWQVIGLFAEELGVEVQDLTVVVFAHEWAHAYTHLGKDANGHSWDTRSFSESDDGLVEGLAQYYTKLSVEKLEKQYPLAREAYHVLLQRQPPDYQTHIPWVRRSSPEAVRLAMLIERRQSKGTLATFERALCYGNEELREPLTL